MNPSQISNHFTWHEATYLPSWQREATEADGLSPIIRANLVIVFSKLDAIRDHFKAPIHVHVAYRPPAYNKLIGGAAKSSHMEGKAVDFDIEGIDCDKARQDILDNNLLEKLGLRMEDRPGSNWIHLDVSSVPPGGHRFFIP